MTRARTRAPTSEELDAYQRVADALGMRPYESLAGAAFRVSRLNCATPDVLRIARRILGASARGALNHWPTVLECDALLRTPREATP